MPGLSLREEKRKMQKSPIQGLKFFFHVMKKQRLRKKILGERTEFLLGSIEPLMPAEAGMGEIRKIVGSEVLNTLGYRDNYI